MTSFIDRLLEANQPGQSRAERIDSAQTPEYQPPMAEVARQGGVGRPLSLVSAEPISQVAPETAVQAEIERAFVGQISEMSAIIDDLRSYEATRAA